MLGNLEMQTPVCREREGCAWKTKIPVQNYFLHTMQTAVRTTTIIQCQVGRDIVFLFVKLSHQEGQALKVE